MSATGYSNGAPTGRYIAPANSPACIESVNGFGDCGVRSLIVSGPKVMRFDFNLIKQIKVSEKLTLEGQSPGLQRVQQRELQPGELRG